MRVKRGQHREIKKNYSLLKEKSHRNFTDRLDFKMVNMREEK